MKRRDTLLSSTWSACDPEFYFEPGGKWPDDIDAIAKRSIAKSTVVATTVADLSPELIAAQPRHAADLRRCASSLAWLHEPDAPTVLIYRHYDVRLADPRQQMANAFFTGCPNFPSYVMSMDIGGVPMCH